MNACHHCGRSIVLKDGAWIDPEATGDDSVWRETCDENHEDRIAAHEPVCCHAADGNREHCPNHRTI